MKDHEQQEALVKESSSDWTIVRPAAFTGGPVTSRYKHGEAAKMVSSASKFRVPTSRISWSSGCAIDATRLSVVLTN